MSTATSPVIASQLTRDNLIQIAVEIYDARPTWVTFFREVLGVDGLVRQVYDTPQSLAEYERTAEFRELHLMVAKLRENDDHQPGRFEPTRVITVRLPKSLHEALKAEAHNRHLSLNQLCIAKTLQVLDDKPAREAT